MVKPTIEELRARGKAVGDLPGIQGAPSASLRVQGEGHSRNRLATPRRQQLSANADKGIAQELCTNRREGAGLASNEKQTPISVENLEGKL